MAGLSPAAAHLQAAASAAELLELDDSSTRGLLTARAEVLAGCGGLWLRGLGQPVAPCGILWRPVAADWAGVGATCGALWHPVAP